nr:MAG TPA: hypothetical protein [Caudoviricetes sp.]
MPSYFALFICLCPFRNFAISRKLFYLIKFSA